MLPETIALSWTDKDKIEEKRGERGEDKREKRERERERESTRERKRVASVETLWIILRSILWRFSGLFGTWT